MNAPVRRDIAVGITVYRPDMALLGAIFSTAAQQAGAVYLLIDGPIGEAISPAEEMLLASDPALRILHFESNRGIAAGLNELAAAAAADGFERILFFDQDSDVPPDLVARLDTCFMRLALQGEPVAAVGPRIVAAPASDTKAPNDRRRGPARDAAVPVDFAIVSGCLLDLDAWRRVGPFREALRMDGVDVEWGFRAWARGFSVWRDEASALPHRVGAGVVRFGPIAFPRQSEARMANYARSQAACLRLPHIPLRWKLRSAAYVPLQVTVYASRSGRPLRAITRMLRAVRDGWRDGRAEPDR